MPSTDVRASAVHLRSPFHAAAAGLGLRRALLQDLRDAPAGDFDFLECAPENWIGVGGLAGDVLARLGVVAQQADLAKLAEAFEKDGLQAVAGAGAYDDEKLGLNKVAKYYYAPGWWAGGEQLSLYINDEAWNQLPKHYQSVVQSAALAAHTAATARYDALNPQALAQLTANGAQVRAFPRSIMDAAFEASQQVYKDLSAKDPRFKALHDSYMGFRDSEMPWFRLTEGAFGQYLGVALSGRS